MTTIEKMKARSKKFAELVDACEKAQDICSVYPYSLEAIQKVTGDKLDALTEKEQGDIRKVTPVLKEYLKKLQALVDVVNAYEVKNIFIKIDWTKNVYGYQAKAHYEDDYRRLEGARTGGCGYDKPSTASAAVLNNPAVAKLVLDYLKANSKDDQLGYTKGRVLLGYGMYISEYTGLPVFEGGVGIECHCNIFKNLGFKVLRFSDAYHFSK